MCCDTSSAGRPGTQRSPGGAAERALDLQLNSVITWLDPAAVPRPSAGTSLGGLRLGLKDNIDTAGVLTSCASAFYSGHIPDEDADVVVALRKAGADITAKLNMAEFAVGVTSQNSFYGGCLNPWDVSRVPGGSSGGSGVAVAAGLVDVALGTDTGGSIRLPAAMCGVVGLRPTVGRISTRGIFPVSTLVDTVGPLARDVGSVARVFKTLATAGDGEARMRRVGIPRNFFTTDVDPGVHEVLLAALRQFESMGLELVDVYIPFAETAQDVVYTIIYSQLARIHGARLESSPERFQPDTLARLRLGLSLTTSDWNEALEAKSEFQRGLDNVFSDVDVILTPTLPVDVPILSSDDVLDVSRRLGQFSYPWSLHSGPTLALPVGFHPKSGMPVGAQLTGATGRDESLLALGASFQERTSWHMRRPSLSVSERGF